MKKALFSAALAVAASLAIAAPAAAQETERVDKTVPIQPGGRVVLKTFSGSVNITAGGGGQVVVHAVRRGSRDRLDHVKLDVEARGNEVYIDANKRDPDWEDHNNNVVETAFEIEVPRDAELDVNSFSSDVHVIGVGGREKVKAFSGDLDIEGARGPLEAETFSGRINVTLDPAAGGRVDFDTFSGNLRASVPLTLESTSKRSVRGQIGTGSSDFRFKTFSGDVRLR